MNFDLFTLILIFAVIIIFFKTEREFDIKKMDTVSDLFPFAYSLEEGIIAMKNGSFSQTFILVGQDLDSLTEERLVNIRASLNRILKKLPEDTVINFEARRRKSAVYPSNYFDEEILEEIDNIRKEKYNSGNYYETDYFLTISYYPETDNTSKVKDTLVKKEKNHDDYKKAHDEIKNFKNLIKLFLEEVKDHFISIKTLNTKETLEYFHNCISDHPDHEIHPLPDGTHLDYLADTSISTGITIKKGENIIKTIVILSYPTETTPNMFSVLNELDIEYRWVSRFIYIPDEEVKKISESKKYKYFSKRKGLMSKLFPSDDLIMNNEALNRAEETDQMREAVAEQNVKGAYYNFTIVLEGKDEDKLNNNCIEILGKINKLGYVAKIENILTMDTFLGTIPGDVHHGIRQPLIHSLNYIDMLPISTNFSGYNKNKHLNGEALIICESNTSTPFKLNLHVDDVAHTLIMGRTGGGKSVLLGILALNFRKYKDNQILIFDKGGSSRVLTAGVGGKFFDLGVDNIAFQPLRNIHENSELEFAYSWLLTILEEEKLAISSEIKKSLLETLKIMANMPLEQRTISTYCLLEQNKDIQETFYRYTNDPIKGVYGKYFDNDHDDFSIENSFQVFEMEQLFNNKTVLVLMLEYLFHKLEKEMFAHEKPTLLILDECWLMLDNKRFAEKIKEWMKILRKKNVALVLATQQLSDVANSIIKNPIMESCLTKIYLPNKEMSSQNEEAYLDFGLNDREIESLRIGRPKLDYLYKSSLGSRVFQLGLSKLELAYVGSAGSDDQQKCIEILESLKGENISEKEKTKLFNKEWKVHKNI